ncbi:UL16-binding protein 1-like [Erinaceus europaeus]|uniref:UL16-binding protein 1-like n=1 Tax=Erinaceus europaeus TaxID=9365 RepID=A0ABM3YJS5_ERIEU|nr:UL16-binding protein 1-like [Erinaceus europaeus]
MAGSAGAKFRLHILVLSLLWWYSRVTGSDIHSLSYDFTMVPKLPSLVRWCEVQGQVDGQFFLSYDCASEKVKALTSLQNETDAIKTWESQMKTLNELLEMLRMNLLDVNPETVTTRETDPVFLQGRVTCQKEASGVTHGSWQFGFDGQMSLLFDSEKGGWKDIQPQGILIKETLNKDENVFELLMNISIENCKIWLEEVLVHLGEKASKNIIPGRAQSKFLVVTPDPWIFLVILSCLITFFTQGGVLVQRERLTVPPSSP